VGFESLKPLVIKIGGSIFSNSDTTVEDLVTLQKRDVPLVVVHGGGNVASDWLGRLGISTSFVRGLRVTDLETLRVVTAVLAGLVNKELVSAIWRSGGKAVGLSGVDGGLMLAKNKTPELGYTGEELKVNVAVIELLLKAGYISVIAPISLGLLEGSDTDTNLLNVNGDTAAGEIAAALNVEKLIFLTDVPGLYDGSKKFIHKLSPQGARELIDSGVAAGGMAAKLEACLTALTRISVTRIIDGRVAHALLDEVEGRGDGTTIGW
jgi:acetylglutamate kinase